MALIVRYPPASYTRDTIDAPLIPRSGRSPGVWIGTPLQYSCLKYSMGRGAWYATVHMATKSWTRLSANVYYLCTLKSDIKPRVSVKKVPKALNPYLWMKSHLTTGGWGLGDSLSSSLPQWPLWLQTDSLTSGITSSGEKCFEGTPALCNLASLHRREHTPYCKSRMNYQRLSEDKVQSLHRLRRTTFGGSQKIRLQFRCKHKLVHGTHCEPVHQTPRFLGILD